MSSVWYCGLCDARLQNSQEYCPSCYPDRVAEDIKSEIERNTVYIEDLEPVLAALRKLGHEIKTDPERTLAQDTHDTLGKLMGVFDENGAAVE